MTASYLMRVSSNGQVSIPAETRARWSVDRVVVVDLGDRVVMRPLPSDPLEDIQGKYRSVGPSADESRVLQRAEDGARR
jgi:hypothetical protein